jgi:hypothetical protein
LLARAFTLVFVPLTEVGGKVATVPPALRRKAPPKVRGRYINQWLEGGEMNSPLQRTPA